MTFYSYCEPITASSNSKWHIRKLTEKGKCLGGGADTDSLCGREVSWDIQAEIHTETIKASRVEFVCGICQQLYRAEMAIWDKWKNK